MCWNVAGMQVITNEDPTDLAPLYEFYFYLQNVSTSKVSGSEIRPVSQASAPLILDEKFDNAR